MAKGRPRKQGRRKKAVELRFERPTPERAARGGVTSAGAAVRMTTPIEAMHRAGKLSETEFKALSIYAEAAMEMSPLKSNIDFTIYGKGDGMPPSVVVRGIEAGWYNAALGSLQPIAHGICVEDFTVSEWAQKQYGSRERTRISDAGKPITWFEPTARALEIANAEFAAAVKRLTRVVGAKIKY